MVFKFPVYRIIFDVIRDVVQMALITYDSFVIVSLPDGFIRIHFF